MTTARLLGVARPLSSSSIRLNGSWSTPSTSTALGRLSKAWLTGDRIVSGDRDRGSSVRLKASGVVAPESVTTSDPQANGGVSLASLLASTAAAAAVVKVVRQAVNSRPPKFRAQMFLERV